MANGKRHQSPTVKEEQLPAELADMMEQDAGKGVSVAQEDNLVPLMYVLQKGSPQVNKRDELYIEDAEAGDIWLRNAPSPIVKGTDGVLFQPCYFYKDWVEWIPRDAGGGFVGRWRNPPPEATKKPNTRNPNAFTYVMPNGNELVETRSHVGFAITKDGPMPYVIPFKSTGHSVSRQWMFMINNKRTGKGSKAPAWANYYKLVTKLRKNKDGDWFVFEPKDGSKISTMEEYERGKALFEAFESGAKEAEAEVQTEHPAAAADDTM